MSARAAEPAPHDGRRSTLITIKEVVLTSGRAKLHGLPGAWSAGPAAGACTMTIGRRTIILKPGAGFLHIKDDRFDPPIKVDGHDVSRYGLTVRNEGAFPIEAFRPTDTDRGGRFP